MKNLRLLLIVIPLLLYGCRTFSDKSQEVIKKENEKLSKFLKQPEAELKIYLTASIEERTKRRQSQLKRQGSEVNMPVLLQELETRDRQDMDRKHSPLKPAKDSFKIDTTNITPEEVLKEIKNLSRNLVRK